MEESKPWYKGPLGKIVFVLFIVTLLSGVAGLAIVTSNTSSTKTANKKISPTSTEKIEAPTSTGDFQQVQGTYMDYNYTILYQQGESKYVVTFQPFLPRDDTIVTGAMLEAINKIFGKTTIKDLAPQVVSRNGTNLIEFTGTDKNYYFLLVKEDTGEVHSMSFWSEPQTRHEILSRRENMAVENIDVLIPKGEDAQAIATEVKKTCKKSCNINIYDEKRAFELQHQYDTMMSDPNTQPVDLQEWKKKNYIYVAEHYVGSVEFSTGIFDDYPFKDWYYQELKGQ